MDLKMVPLVFLLILTLCAASPQDLCEKVFTFPQETDTANVKLNIQKENLRAVTVCFRFITNLNRPHSLFSLATTQYHNKFLIFKDTAANSLDLHVDNRGIRFEGLDYELNTWHSVCSTWDVESGLGQLWFDGKPTDKKFLGGSPISQALVVLGQEQDSYGGTFDSKQSFVGMMSEVHMWDYTLSPRKIDCYVKGLNFPPGNILNWGELTFQTTGRVLIEERLKTCI